MPNKPKLPPQMGKPLLFIAAFALGVVSMPLVFGLLTKYHLKGMVKDSNLPEGILLEVKSYDLGYFSSHALMNVIIMDPKQLNQPTELPHNVITFNVEADIKHGPFFKAGKLDTRTGLAHIHAYLEPDDIALSNEALEKTLAAIFIETEIVSLDATLSLTAALNAHLHSSDANYHADDGTVSWGGVDGTLFISRNNNVMDASLDISPMLLQATNKSSLDFSRISILSKAKRKDDMPWTGEQAINIPSFYMQDETGREIRFSNLIFTANSDIKDKLASVHVEGKADNLQLYTQIINDTKISMIIERLDAKSLIDFSKVTQKNVNELNEEEKRALTQALVTMLSPGASFKFSHNMNIEEGPVNADITVEFPNLSDNLKTDPIETVAQRLMMELQASLAMQTPNKWLETTLYNIALAKLPPNTPDQVDPVTKKKISPEEALRKDIDNQLKTLSQAGVLINDGTHYAFHLNYDKGNIILNGNKLTQEDITKLMNLFSDKQQ